MHSPCGNLRLTLQILNTEPAFRFPRFEQREEFCGCRFDLVVFRGQIMLVKDSSRKNWRVSPETDTVKIRADTGAFASIQIHV